MANDKADKLKALKLTLDKLDKTYGKGTVMKMGDSPDENVEAISSGSLGLDIALGVIYHLLIIQWILFKNSNYLDSL